ncbi:MAG: hypothetical protein PHC43_07045 [Candidatus Marinimicrobia bacterium]|jgi:hypothetical protein|nr:hypothetical protein [Candidatus Neomarinimicrobiota bacterium]
MKSSPSSSKNNFDTTAPNQIAIHYHLLPLSEADGCLVIGTINPENVTLKQGLEFLLSREIRFEAKVHLLSAS